MVEAFNNSLLSQGKKKTTFLTPRQPTRKALQGTACFLCLAALNQSEAECKERVSRENIGAVSFLHNTEVVCIFIGMLS